MLIRLRIQYRTAFIAPIALLLITSLYLLNRRVPVEERSNGAQPTSAVRSPTQDIAMGHDAVTDRSDPARGPASIDLRDVSQTFRNSTLLFAIRRAGFHCADVVSANETTEDVWLAGCSDTIRYIVAELGAERFDVHPVAYGDAVAPVPDRELPPEPGSL